MSAAVRRSLGRRGEEIQLVSGRHPAEFAGEPVDLLVYRPGLGRLGRGALGGVRRAPAPRRGGASGPGDALPQRRQLRHVPQGYPHLSSLEGDKICLALQREIVSLAGHVVERQEFVVPFPPGEDPMAFLAAAGVLLLLGAKPEENCPSFGGFCDKIVSAGQAQRGSVRAAQAARGHRGGRFYAPQSTAQQRLR